MSWTNELYAIYDLALNIEEAGDGKGILPVSHSTQNAQIELTISESGDFVDAQKIDKAEAVTIIPVTESSGARSSGICPMPFADKLLYIAGDYSEFAEGKRSDNSEYFNAYMQQLRSWKESEYSHKAVNAVYNYLSKGNLMKDLVGSGVLVTNENTGKLLEKTKIAGISQEDSFVRFRIQYNLNAADVPCSETWKDKTLYDSFVQFNRMNSGKNQLCYATGKELPATYKHPSKIRNSGDKAKLISSNDESGFTYRGRFANKEEAISVSYDFSQKFHNALKWLIGRQGIPIDSLTLIVWASGLVPIPEPTYSVNEYGEEEADEFGEYDSVVNFRERMKKCIFGCKKEFKSDTKAIIMGLDAATTGRLSIATYAEVDASQYLKNMEKWHEETMWLRFNGKLKRSEYNSFSIKMIANCAFGTEQGSKLECKKEVLRETTLRLLPCITEARKLPKDIMNALFIKASNPLSYNYNNFQKVLEAACGMIQKYYIDHNDKRGRIYMAYDPNITDRSYLFGCLLAIADKAESEAYEDAERNVRVTNAKRYWNAFSQRPAQTWKNIEERLRPYLNKLGKSQVKYVLWINEISNKLDCEKFSNARLEPLYLLGYHNFMDYMYNGNRNEKTEE